jgi:hypothetical protein
MVSATAGPEEVEKARALLDERLHQVTALADVYAKGEQSSDRRPQTADRRRETLVSRLQSPVPESGLLIADR